MASPRRVRRALSQVARRRRRIGETGETHGFRASWRGGKRHERGFLAVLALLFAASAALTVVWSLSMSAMGGMPMPGGSTMSTAWMRMPGETWAGAAASFVGMWAVMMTAMMLPSLAPMLQRYRRAVGGTGDTRLSLLPALVGAGYFLVWSSFGMAAFPLGVALAAPRCGSLHCTDWEGLIAWNVLPPCRSKVGGTTAEAALPPSEPKRFAKAAAFCVIPHTERLRSRGYLFCAFFAACLSRCRSWEPQSLANAGDDHDWVSIPFRLYPHFARDAHGVCPRLGNRAQLSLFPLSVRRRGAAGCA